MAVWVAMVVVIVVIPFPLVGTRRAKSSEGLLCFEFYLRASASIARD